MIYDGEYLNGKKNGEGKEYHVNKIMFEDKYMNDEKLIGKKWDKNWNIICEINNTNGKGKEYDGIGNLIYSKVII